MRERSDSPEFMVNYKTSLSRAIGEGSEIFSGLYVIYFCNFFGGLEISIVANTGLDAPPQLKGAVNTQLYPSHKSIFLHQV
jgi:hypothetical protein